jgi:hypothetical protein
MTVSGNHAWYRSFFSQSNRLPNHAYCKAFIDRHSPQKERSRFSEPLSRTRRCLRQSVGREGRQVWLFAGRCHGLAGGVRSIVAESLLLKHQLLLLNCSRQRSPNLCAWDRILVGSMALLVPPTRLLRSAIVLNPSTLLALHKAMSKRKYRMLFSTNRRRSPVRKDRAQNSFTRSSK